MIRSFAGILLVTLLTAALAVTAAAQQNVQPGSATPRQSGATGTGTGPKAPGPQVEDREGDASAAGQSAIGTTPAVFLPRRIASTCPIKGTARKNVKWFVGGLFPAFTAN